MTRLLILAAVVLTLGGCSTFVNWTVCQVTSPMDDLCH